MLETDIDSYVGIPYCPRTMDCADFVLLVQRECLGRDVQLPGKRPRPLNSEQQAQCIATYCRALACPTDTPQTGDVVLMRDAGSALAGHVGVYAYLNHTAYVLHTSHAMGASTLHRLHDLPGYGLHIEGFYKWSVAT